MARILLIPGWHGSGADHWQTAWHARYGDEWVEQSDWVHPLRGDWMTRLDEVIQSSASQAVLVAHSLGCQLVASWAGHSRFTGKVRAAMLVAPADTERADISPALHSWRPVALAPLPFPSTVVASTDDPYCEFDRAREFANHWLSDLISVGPKGHVNSGSGLGDWPEGRALLEHMLDHTK